MHTGNLANKFIPVFVWVWCSVWEGSRHHQRRGSREERRVGNHTPYFIRPSSCHISDPLDTGVITLLEHFEVAHQQARASEHQQTEGERQRRSRPGLLVRHGCKCCICTEHVFRLTCKSRNSIFLHVRYLYVVEVAELK